VEHFPVPALAPMTGRKQACITGKMPYDDGSNSSPNGTRKQSSGLASLVQAEKLMQIAFILPCTMLIGWGAGWWVDKHFHQDWATITGLVFGLVAGMVSVVRMALAAGGPTKGSTRGGK
jgi:ATP synthase protein I